MKLSALRWMVPALLALACCGGVPPAPAQRAPSPRTTPTTAPRGGGAPSLPAQLLSPQPAYVHHVAPLLLRLGCATAACHGTAQGRGGLHLSLFGAESEADREALVKGRVVPGQPEASLLVKKLTGQVSHGGGKRIRPGSPEYRLLAAWIAHGAALTDQPRVQVSTVTASTERLDLGSGRATQVRMRATFSDKSIRDVTALTHFRIQDPAIARVDSWGRVSPVAPGETHLVATFCRRAAVVRVVNPQRLPTPFPASTGAGPLDTLWLARLRELGIPPSPPCSDAVFLRRVYLDAIGTLPTVAEARAFLADARPDKRRRLVDRLLERDEFADYQALRWGDILRIKAEYPVRLWPKGAQAYHRFVRDSMAKGKPHDQFVRELLTASGSAFRHGEANYFRAVPTRNPQTLAETTALLFMGTRLSCVRCHADPNGTWTQADHLGLAACFGQVKFKNTGEWKEEIVCVDPEATFRPAKGAPVVAPSAPGGGSLPQAREEDARQRLAAWLTAPQNPWFARSTVNRTWAWLMGRGLVEQVDDMRPTNPACNPPLLDYLARELVEHRYNLRHVFRLILNSQAYQASSEATRWNRSDTTHFSHYLERRLPAEVLLDAIAQVTGSRETFTSQIPEPYTRMVDFRAIALPDGSLGTPTLSLFGRPPRDTSYDCDRTSLLNQQQVLHLVDSVELERKISRGSRVARLVAERRSGKDVVDELYLAALSRLPRPEESAELTRLLQAGKPQPIIDLVWALLNSHEFLFNH